MSFPRENVARTKLGPPLSDVVKFFEAKKPWSKYKDLILDYYLHPYLAKVARLRKPIAIVDCFAGAGRFDDGEPGSPIIITKHLRELAKGGVSVQALLIEKDKLLYDRLRSNVADAGIHVQIRHGDFRNHADEIAKLASTHTLFLYVDPIAPGQLHFGDLRVAYEKLSVGQSIETLVNFLSGGFVRRAEGLLPGATHDGLLDKRHDEVLECDAIAGGQYWQEIVTDDSLKHSERVERVASAYANCLHAWFRFVLTYPIREKYTDQVPKYHLIFGSRHEDAIELMNSAMVKARRKSIEAQYVEGMLFPHEPAEEVPDPNAAEQLIVETLGRIGETTWKMLRVHATISLPCKFTKPELNKAIKHSIQTKKIGSQATGTRIEDKAKVWPIST